MPKFHLTVFATAEIKEIWEVEADDEAAAREIFEDGGLRDATFVSDEVMGEERDRVLDEVELVP